MNSILYSIHNNESNNPLFVRLSQNKGIKINYGVQYHPFSLFLTFQLVRNETDRTILLIFIKRVESILNS
jgi:hypothetical protein